MKMSSQRGMALVTSLIMLGLVTLLAIAFIGLSRRERHSVEVTKKTTEAKMMADASLARAQVEVMERLRNNINFQLITSTNGVPPAAPTVDPVVPVSYTVNGAPVDRTFLDLNRNSGLSGLSESTTTTKTGDPQWIGMLEDPTQPHGPDNRFTGRYAYMVVPASKATGLEWMNSTHHAAAMFHQLDPSAVSSASRVNWPYDHYYPSGPWAARSGLAFNDATVWLANRSRLLEPNADVFNPSTIKVGANFVGRLTNAAVVDPYTFYKLAGSFSPDGGLADKCLLPVPPYITNKFNLNNTGLAPAVYFKEVADRLLAASALPVVSGGVVKYQVGTLNAGALLSFPPTSTGILVYPEYQYTPEVHRLLQLAANITDARLNTVDYHPLVFRPVLAASGGQVFISGFVQEIDANFLGNPTVHLPSGIASVNAASLAGIIQHSSGVSSLPILIASKKRWPRPDPSLGLTNPFSPTPPLPPDPLDYLSRSNPSTHVFPNLNEISLLTVGNTVTNSPTTLTLNVAANVYLETWNSTAYPSYLFGATANKVPITFGLDIVNSLSGSVQWPAGIQSFASTKATNLTITLTGPPSSNFHTIGTTHTNIPSISFAYGPPRPIASLQMTNWVRHALIHSSKVVEYASIVQMSASAVGFPLNGASVSETSSQVDDPLVNNSIEEFQTSSQANYVTTTTLTTLNIGRQNPTSSTQPSPSYAYTDRELVRPNAQYAFTFHSGNFGNVGQLGHIHRGTPWQTVFFKSYPQPAIPWDATVKRIPETHATNDWRLPDLFTAAASAAAATGLPSVNNTSDATWAAVLSGVSMRTQPEDWITPGTRDYVLFDLSQHPGYNWGSLNPYPNNNRYQLFRQDKLISYTAGGCTSVVTTNGGGFALNFSNPNYRYYTYPAPTFQPVLNSYATNFTITVSGLPFIFSGDLITPLTQSINAQRNNAMGNGKPFALTGQVLGTPGLTVGGIAPFSWNWRSTDQDDERIPLQILSRLRVEDEPIVVVYAWGQSLKPARITTSAVNVGFVENYVVTGQVGTRTVLRIKNFNPAITNQPPRMVVESFKVLP